MKLYWWVVVMVVGLVGLAGPAGAGGWAVSSLDSLPLPQAGEVVSVGFVIRQHGVTPVNPDGEVGIVITSASGEVEFFAAQAEGEVGHYVAEVTFSEAGTWSWAVRQGWFSDQELGFIDVQPVSPVGDVQPASPVGVGSSGYRWSGWVRFGLPALALGFGLFAVGDAVLSSRRGQRGRPAVL